MSLNSNSKDSFNCPDEYINTKYGDQISDDKY